MKIILNDGTEIPGGSCGYSEGFLWCYFSGFSLQEAAEMFFNPDKTQVIRFEYGEMADVYEGFTNCVAFNLNADGKISVCLTKGVIE